VSLGLGREEFQGARLSMECRRDKGSRAVGKQKNERDVNGGKYVAKGSMSGIEEVERTVG